MTETGRSTMILMGRVLLSAIFLLAGFEKLSHWTATEQYMAQHGMVGTSFLLPAAVAIEVFAGLAVLTGTSTRAAALTLFLFLIPTTLIFHDFWVHSGADQQNQMQHFLKNVAILGGLLELGAVGAGAFSVDALLGRGPVGLWRAKPTA